MYRVGRTLTLDGRELSNEEVRELVGEQNYRTYLSARKQIGVGRAFTPVFWATAAGTIVLSIVYLAEPDYGVLLAAGITGTAANISLPLMCIFKGIGKGRINWVADEYNMGRTRYFQYGFTPSIMRLEVPDSGGQSLGYGGTFTISF